MDPGRKRNEMREAQYVAVGETIVGNDGLTWEVLSFYSGHTYVRLSVQRKHGDRTFEKEMPFLKTDEIKVRNRLTPNS